MPGSTDGKPTGPLPPDRKQRGAWYTPPDLVDLVVDAALDRWPPRATGSTVAVVDPACGDGRFLRAVGDQLVRRGHSVRAVGVDIDVDAVAASRSLLAAADIDHEVLHGDALTIDWGEFGSFDLVVGNPPFLSQMATSTSRGGSSSRGGGPYADAAAEFLALGAELVEPASGRVAFVLPQSLLSARDAGAIRARYDAVASIVWSWWTGERVFDAHVLTCGLVFQFGAPAPGPQQWGRVVTGPSGVPDLPGDLTTDGVLGDRCRLNANFRDEYYGMVPAVGDHRAGPKLITSGLIDPGRNWWGERPIRFAKQVFERPRLDLARLDDGMRRWADQRLVPKALIANQTKILEAVADPDGSTLPGVPVVAAYPHHLDADAEVPAGQVARRIAAVLTSPFASAWAWHRSAGTGLSSDAIRVGPVLLADLPWPAGSLDDAVDAMEAGELRRCGALVDAAYGIGDRDALAVWWDTALTRIEARQPTKVTAPPQR